MDNSKQKKIKDFLINNGVIIVMFILVIYTGFTSKNFFTPGNLMNILMNMSARLVIALGIAGCVITAGCDLSEGHMIGFGGCIAGVLLQRMDYSGKFFPGYGAFKRVSGGADRYGHLCVLRKCDGIFYLLPECSALHRNAGDDGDRLRYQHAFYQCDASGRLCQELPGCGER